MPHFLFSTVRRTTPFTRHNGAETSTRGATPNAILCLSTCLHRTYIEWQTRSDRSAWNAPFLVLCAMAERILSQNNAAAQAHRKASTMLPDLRNLPTSPSKEHGRKTAPVCRKYVVSLAFLASCIILLVRSPDAATLVPGNRTTKVQHNPIRLISILGERNSGTRWTFE